MSSNPAQYAFEGRETSNNRASHRDNVNGDDEGYSVVSAHLIANRPPGKCLGYIA